MPKAATSRITVDELGRKLSDLSIPEEELAQYFQLDEAASTPTKPELEAQPRHGPDPARDRRSKAAPARRSC